MKLHKFYYAFVALVVIVGLFFYFQNQSKQENSPAFIPLTSSSMKLTSSAFEHNQNIPKKYTCDAGDISPPLEISEIPEGTQSLALIVDDPDAPVGDWVHWTVWNIDPVDTKIPEGGAPTGAVEGTTDFGKPGYGGPCPPSGTHRYFFKLFALDAPLNLLPSASKSDIEAAMEDHILARAQLIGLYQRS